MALACKAWGCLPYAGGLLDQPVRLMRRMQAAYGVYLAYRSYGQKTVSDAEWSLQHPEYWRVVVEVSKLMEAEGDQG
jgi:hypothetical protein